MFSSQYHMNTLCYDVFAGLRGKAVNLFNLLYLLLTLDVCVCVWGGVRYTGDLKTHRAMMSYSDCT